MRKWFWILMAGMLILLAACRTGEPPTVDQPAAAPPAIAPVVTNGEDPFRPSNPATVNLASGRPQLVEFFAFW